MARPPGLRRVLERRTQVSEHDPHNPDVRMVAQARAQFPLFHPRRERWEQHFVFADHSLFVVGVTDIGRATERALGVNDPRRNGPLGARHLAIVQGRYPPPWARDWGY